MKTLYLVETTSVEYDDYSWDEPTPEPRVEAICETRELARAYANAYLQDFREEDAKIEDEGNDSWTIDENIRISIRSSICSRTRKSLTNKEE